MGLLCLPLVRRSAFLFDSAVPFDTPRPLHIQFEPHHSQNPTPDRRLLRRDNWCYRLLSAQYTRSVACTSSLTLSSAIAIRMVRRIRLAGILSMIYEGTPKGFDISFTRFLG